MIASFNFVERAGNTFDKFHFLLSDPNYDWIMLKEREVRIKLFAKLEQDF
jgi:hypothetical protein